MTIQIYPEPVSSSGDIVEEFVVYAPTITTTLQSFDIAEDFVGYVQFQKSVKPGVWNFKKNSSSNPSVVIFGTNLTNFTTALSNTSDTARVELSTAYNEFFIPVTTSWTDLGVKIVFSTSSYNFNFLIGNGTNWIVGASGGALTPSCIIYTSTNLTTWTLRTFAFTGTAANFAGQNSAIWDGTYFQVAYGLDNVGISTSGATWTTRAVFTTSSVGAAYLSNKVGDYYFAAGGHTFLGISTDGVNWSTRTNPITQFNVTAPIVAYNPASAQYVRAGNSALFNSTNLTNWTTRLVTGLTSHNGGVAFGNGWFVNSGNTFSTTLGKPILAVSTNGFTWTTSNINTWSTGLVKWVDFENGYFIVHGGANALNQTAFSTNPVNLTWRRYDTVYNNTSTFFFESSTSKWIMAESNGSQVPIAYTEGNYIQGLDALDVSSNYTYYPSATRIQ